MYSKGVVLAIAAAGVSGISVYINKFGVNLWANASTYTTAKNIVAAIFLTSLILLFGKVRELKSLSKKQWMQLLVIAAFGGSVPFLLFFKSLTMVSAVEAAFIQKTLFLWVALFSYPFLKERLHAVQVAALGLLLFAVVMLGAPTRWTFGTGALCVLAATLLWAIETIVVKKVLVEISATTVAWARMFFGSLMLLGWLAATQSVSNVIPQTFDQAFWAIAVGIILFVYVTLWYSALELAPATVVSSVLVIAAPITAIIDGFISQGTIQTKIALPLLLMLVSVALISNQFARVYSKLSKKHRRTIFS